MLTGKPRLIGVTWKSLGYNRGLRTDWPAISRLIHSTEYFNKSYGIISYPIGAKIRNIVDRYRRK